MTNKLIPYETYTKNTLIEPLPGDEQMPSFLMSWDNERIYLPEVIFDN